ncbi:hypothetical protein C493_00965 [Natronolimnohabitans innermongolicus JCM 12255]|uniref:Uncharacterized protein n=1 Tax=Natronolimnohabitans innermongolicus JCM 12255 TaxID=1227499 RepID=L9XKQ0_9EURY|nr:hypothetical protein C493_00965 [Natronolimnohabitans innermongolicus JCM 12255]
MNETEQLSHHHVHLPKLADYDLIEWHRGICCVERGPRFDEVRPLLEQLPDGTDSSPMRG